MTTNTNKTTTTPRGLIAPAWKITGLLDGRVTQWRVPVKDQSLVEFDDDGLIHLHAKDCPSFCDYACHHPCPLGKPGDRLFVKETWALRNDVDPKKEPERARQYALYRASYRGSLEDEWHSVDGWRSPVHMPRELARIWLEIESVRVERVQEISGLECESEGIWSATKADDSLIDMAVRLYGAIDRAVGVRDYFRVLWDRTHPGSWDRNDYVWVPTFRRVEAS